jgi:p-cumate 2,3-dioxygenase beta subunit
MSSSLSTVTRGQVEDFLFHECDVLERWDLDAWHALFTPDGRYQIPTLDDPLGEPSSSQHFVADDPDLLAARITRLKSRNAHAENPRSVTHRLISNVRILGITDKHDLEVRATFMVHRVRDGRVDTFPGWYHHHLASTDDGLKFRLRRVLIASERLRQGRLSFVL